MPGAPPVAAPRETRSTKRSEEQAHFLPVAAVLVGEELKAVWNKFMKSVRRNGHGPLLSPGFVVALRAAERIGHYVTGEFHFLGYSHHHHQHHLYYVRRCLSKLRELTAAA